MTTTEPAVSALLRSGFDDPPSGSEVDAEEQPPAPRLSRSAI